MKKLSLILFGIGIASSLAYVAGARVEKSFVCELGFRNLRAISIQPKDDSQSALLQYLDGQSVRKSILLDRNAMGALSAKGFGERDGDLGYDLSSLLRERNQEAYLRYDSRLDRYFVDFYMRNPGTFNLVKDGEVSIEPSNSVECRPGTLDDLASETAALAAARRHACEMAVQNKSGTCDNEKRAVAMASPNGLGTDEDAGSAQNLLDRCLENAITACLSEVN